MTANPVPEAPKEEVSTAPSMPGKVARKATQDRGTGEHRTAPEAAALTGDPIADRHSAESILWVDDVTVSFDGFKALTDLSLTLDKGELRCIIGPNGAGKTTLMDVITGKTRPDKGSVKLTADGTDLTKLSEFEIARLGIGRKFQRPTVFQGHTVWENLELACKGPKGVWRSLFGWLSAEARQRIDEVLALVGLGDQRDRPAALLAHGHKQWLEIGMLLVQDPQVLLLDEPVAGLTHQETERTAELVKSLSRQRTVVVVEHDMDFVRHIAEKVTVLHEGKLLAEGPMEKVQKDPKVIEVYLGT
jgi:urea transport system ATP-binding protein